MAHGRATGRQTSSPRAGRRRRAVAKKLVRSDRIAPGPPVDVNPPADRTVDKTRRQPRRLSDHILIAFHQACDERDLEVAEQLLGVLAMVIVGRRHPPTARDRRSGESLVAAYERLWDLRHPCPIGGSDESV